MAKIKTFKEWLRYWYKARIRIRLYRIAIRLSRRWARFKKGLYQPQKPHIDSTQKKAIDLFYVLLKNKNSSLNHSPESSTRIIESEYVWVTMAGKTDSYLLNIIDESRANNPHSHEVYIPKEYGFEMADEFDLELERRYRAIEAQKKRVIADDLDKLIIKANKTDK